MLLMAAHHTITPTEGGPNLEPKVRVVMQEGPYQKWFDTQDHDTLGSTQESFFPSERKQSFEPSPTFEVFHPWLNELHVFSRGFEYKRSWPSNVDEAPPWMLSSVGVPMLTPVPVPLHGETLSGCANYAAIIESEFLVNGKFLIRSSDIRPQERHDQRSRHHKSVFTRVRNLSELLEYSGREKRGTHHILNSCPKRPE